MAEIEVTTESTEPTRSPLPTWSEQFAFGLPAGSIRALLALAIIGSLGAMVALHPKVPISDPFRDLSFLILGGYFAHRRSAQEPELTGPSPLFLPKGAVRTLLSIAILAVIVFMLQRHDSIKPRNNPALYPVFVMIGFLLGVLGRVYGAWLLKRGRVRKRVWADLRATVAILAAAWLIVLAWNDSYQFLPILREGGQTFPITDDGIRHGLAAIVAFYFGSRA